MLSWPTNEMQESCESVGAVDDAPLLSQKQLAFEAETKRSYVTDLKRGA